MKNDVITRRSGSIWCKKLYFRNLGSNDISLILKEEDASLLISH